MSRKKEIHERMRQLNITYSQIAKHVVLSQNDVQKWVEGYINLPYRYVWGIYDLLGLDNEEFGNVL
jgi:predicted transcriptional regulator